VAEWPRILVVTDRHRLLRHLKAQPEQWPELLQAQVLGAIAGGADLVQVREADLAPGLLAGFLRRLFDAAPGAAQRVVVNDRCDVALASAAGGVHLGERSVGIGEARQLAPDGRQWLVGRSVHTRTGAAAARRADYVIAGTVQASASKAPGWKTIGWPGLAAIAAAAGDTPVVAIGGLGVADVPAVRAAGAVGLAGIGCFLPAHGAGVGAGTEARVRELRQAW
jgi:thiamine-phosphate pyrophosphorylase